MRVLFVIRLIAAALVLASLPAAASTEDGYDLWLRYKPVEQVWRARYAPYAKDIVVEGASPTLDAAAAELERGLSGMLGRRIGRSRVRDGSIVLAIDPHIVASEGFVIRSTRLNGHPVTLIAGSREVGVLYGTFELLRRMETRQPIDHLRIFASPRYPLRLLNHWDNLDGTVERGYAGPSIWNWPTLPKIEQRYIDYARANASIGINGTVLNNVNADPRILTPEYLTKVAALANAFRPYGIRVYLTARFSSPIEIGGLKTADPLDPVVKAWWRAKADEIYRLIPDFGGFAIKANSEGQPGPQDYHRSHAEGANVIAQALAPHGGTVFWRAFVYGNSKEDRARQAYDQFRPLDGQFASNVIVQVKNGPIDFQPREPFHPLFGAMPRTRVAMEVQLTREYLGQNSGVAYLGPMWSETLRSRTARPRPASEVRDSLSAIAGVSNIGSDRNWTGSDFDQANWFAFGRLAWNPAADPARIADEWARMTWGNDRRMNRPIVAMMMRSREAAVDYMTPLGLAHQMAEGHHYGPAPWQNDLPTPSWNPVYYNRADARGIGFDRMASGSNAIAQYAPGAARRLAASDDYLLWFHHVPWTHRMRTGRSLWTELIAHYDNGVAAVEQMNRSWALLAPRIDMQRHSDTAARLRQQSIEAHWWRDASIAYWQSLSKLPLPPGHSPPAHSLSYYQAIRFERVPRFLAPRIDRDGLCVVLRGEKPCAY